MNKREMALLEKAFEAEVNGALQGAQRLMQTRSKLAEKLVAEGLLERREESIGSGWSRVTVKGYGLTLLGNMRYCVSCADVVMRPHRDRLPPLPPEARQARTLSR